MSRRLPFFTLAALVAGPLAGCTRHGQDKVTAPAVEVEQLKLANGLIVILALDPTAPAAEVAVDYHVGSRDDPPGRFGLAALAERLLMAPTKHVAPGASTVLARLGAAGRDAIEAGVDLDRTRVAETVPPESLETTLWVEADRLGFLAEALDDKVLAAAKGSLAADRRRAAEAPYAFATELLAQGLYPGGHPYGHTPSGASAEVEATTLAEAQAFIKTYYTPSNATLVISGAFDKAKAKDAVGRLFGTLPPGPALTRFAGGRATLASDTVIQRAERGAPPKLVLSWHAPEFYSKDEVAFGLLARILADGMDSRLSRRLVKDERVAAAVGAVTVPAEMDGVFHIETQLADAAVAGKTRDLILEEVAKLAESGPTERELNERKTAQTYTLISALEEQGGPGGLAGRLAREVTLTGKTRGVQAELDQIQATTTADIGRVAKEWLVQRHHLETRFLSDGVTVSANRADIDRTQPPPVAAAAPFTAPAVETKTLDNGLQIAVVSRPGLPKVEAALVLRHQDLGETDADAGVSYLTALSVTQGTVSRTVEELGQELSGLGAELDVDGDKYGAGLVLSVLKPKLKAGLELLADLAQHPAFPADAIDQLKRRRLTQLAREEQDPTRITATLLPRIMLSGGPGGLPEQGTAQSLARLTRVDLVKTHAAYWVPSNALLVFAGDIKLGEAETLAEQAFGKWTGAAVHDPVITPPAAPAKPAVFLVDVPGSTAAEVRIGLVAPPRTTADWAPMRLLDLALGGTEVSRLTQSLAHHDIKSVALSGLTQNRWFGAWTAATTVPAAATGTAIVTLKDEMDAVAGQKKVSSAELNGAAQILTRTYAHGFGTLADTVRQVAQLALAGAPLTELQTYATELAKQTPEDVASTAGKVLSFDHAVVVVAGDLKTIEGQVLALGLGDTVVIDREGKMLRRAGTPDQGTPNAAGAAAPASAPAPAAMQASAQENGIPPLLARPPEP